MFSRVYKFWKCVIIQLYIAKKFISKKDIETEVYIQKNIEKMFG
jgi:glutaredoxin-related protein